VLTITEDAIAAIQSLTARSGSPDEAGLRIAAAASADGAQTYAVSISSAPQPTDEVVEAAGVRVFLDPNASMAFDAKALHATVAEDKVEFQLTDSPRL
jgi:Fe-S cluster assembly iron-binding protein IscA